MNTAYAGTPGTVGVLNVGAGDIKLSFDKSNPAERIRAARIVADMLRRGFALLVEVPGKPGQYQRAHAFDEDTCEYVIADFDSSQAALVDQADATTTTGKANADAPTPREATEQTGEAPAPAAPARSRGRKRLPAESTRAVAVGRTAGG